MDRNKNMFNLIMEQAKGIEEKIELFYQYYDVNLKVIDKKEAYQVDRYSIELDRTNKTKIANIEKLVDDLSVELGIKNIKLSTDFESGRIVFEVPKKNRKILHMRELGQTRELGQNQKGLQVCLGKDLNNNDYIINLCETPHLLVAGTTGSGKSVFVNSILINLLNNYKKDYLEVSLIDPKKVELSIYKKCDQVKQIANTLEETRTLLNDVLFEIDYRYRQLECYNCRNIESYNQKVVSTKFPYKLIIIDELADILLQDKKEMSQKIKRGEIDANSLETMICRIAQIGRACGVHLIVATQRPSSDIITGLIKANIPSRVAFSVSTKIDSRVILDEKGAEKLTGKGDMLFKMVGDEELHRIQGAFVSDEEIEKAVDDNTDKEEIKRQEVERLTNALKQKEQQEEQEQQRLNAEKARIKQEKSDKRWNTFETICHVIGSILKWSCIILFGGIYLIFKFVSEIAKK